jgi:hypothetical protein
MIAPLLHTMADQSTPTQVGAAQSAAVFLGLDDDTQTPLVVDTDTQTYQLMVAMLLAGGVDSLSAAIDS